MPNISLDRATWHSNPVGDTGLECQSADTKNSVSQSELDLQAKVKLTAKIDWIQGTFKFWDFKNVRRLTDFLGDLLDDEFLFQRDHGFGIKRGEYYAHSVRSLRGIKLGYNLPDHSKRIEGKCWLSINGSALGVATAQGTLYIVHELIRRWEIGYTRIDLAIDDFTRKLLPLKEIEQAVQDGNFYGAEIADTQRQYRQRKKTHSQTIKFGSAQSQERLVIYDKFVESKGKLNCIRGEARFKGDRAKMVGRMLAAISLDECADTFAPLCGSLVAGVVDFRDRSEGVRRSRSKRLDWWEKFIDAVGIGISLPSTQNKATWESKLEWIRSQVETTLSIIKDVMGNVSFHSFMNQICKDGKERYKSEHEAIVRQGLRKRRE